jgi:2-iminobutanoate/2-iminopropanoate deaminase
LALAFEQAEFQCADIVRLQVYTTSTDIFFQTCMDVYIPFIQETHIQQATTLLEVQGLFAGLTIELEATLVQ